jgi:hypothetical protein
MTDNLFIYDASQPRETLGRHVIAPSYSKQGDQVRTEGYTGHYPFSQGVKKDAESLTVSNGSQDTVVTLVTRQQTSWPKKQLGWPG